MTDSWSRLLASLRQDTRLPVLSGAEKVVTGVVALGAAVAFGPELIAIEGTLAGVQAGLSLAGAISYGTGNVVLGALELASGRDVGQATQAVRDASDIAGFGFSLAGELAGAKYKDGYERYELGKDLLGVFKGDGLERVESAYHLIDKGFDKAFGKSFDEAGKVSGGNEAKGDSKPAAGPAGGSGSAAAGASNGDDDE